MTIKPIFVRASLRLYRTVWDSLDIVSLSASHVADNGVNSRYGGMDLLLDETSS